MLRIHIVVTGFGQPHLEEKVRIATRNRETYATSRHSITTTAYVYDDSVDVAKSLYDEVIAQPGIVGEFIYRMDPRLEKERYDRVLLLLDDIELLFNFDEFVDACETVRGLCQPSLSDGSKLSHGHMLLPHADPDHIDHNFGRHRCFEYFCYYMTASDFEKYHTLFDEQTQSMWGLDLLVPEILPCSLFSRFKIRHWFQGSLYGIIGENCSRELERNRRRLSL